MPITQRNVGMAQVGDVKVAQGQVLHALVNTVARTNTTVKTLGVIPANAKLVGVRYGGIVGADPAGNAVLSCGISGGTGVEYISTANVKGSAGVGQYMPATPPLGTVGATAVTVTGIYAETSTASSTGGPWTVVLEYTTAATA